MRELNFHHLRYFWTVATEGTMVAASRRLGVAQPTISDQIQALEQELGVVLFERRGRRLELTDAGKVVLRHADEIFRLGQDLVQSIPTPGEPSTVRLQVGASDNVPKMIVRSILEPAYTIGRPVTVICREWRTDILLAELAVHRLDLVITDAPVPPSVRSRTVSHLMGEDDVGLFAVPALADKIRRGFPKSLHGSTCILPADNTALRGRLDQWFQKAGVRPRSPLEAEDRALMMYFAQSAHGIVPASSRTESEVRRQFGLELIAWLPGVTERYYAVSVERSLKNPAVDAICARAISAGNDPA